MKSCMKTISSVLYVFLIAATLGCSKNSADTLQDTATKFPAPNWKENDTGKYPATMAAVFDLPVTLAAGSTEK